MLSEFLDYIFEVGGKEGGQNFLDYNFEGGIISVYFSKEDLFFDEGCNSWVFPNNFETGCS